MMRTSRLALLVCTGVTWTTSHSSAGDAARTGVQSSARRPIAPVSSMTITAPQRLTGFYHPYGVGVGPVSAPLVAGPAMVEPMSPVGPIGPSAPCGQPVCGCATPFPTYAPPGMAFGGYSAFMFGGPMDPYTLHFGPGFHRYNMPDGHVRFPYYSYRRPWYNPGSPSFNRDLYQPW